MLMIDEITVFDTVAVVALALLLDRWLGEPQRWHPLIGFGTLAQWLEQRFNRHPEGPILRSNFLGFFAVLLLVGLIALLVWLLSFEHRYSVVVELLLLYLALGGASLEQHARRVAEPLRAGDIVTARRQVARLVSRDSEGLNRHQVARAAVESVLENGNDAVFAALFWYLLAGAPGVVAYRLANTLDAMWGYKSRRYLHFGWFAARLDDVMNLIPARLTALTYALLGNGRGALNCWFSQARYWSSPNGGPVMAAGAGALGIRLGGVASYHGVASSRPLLGGGREPNADDIDAATRLVRNGTLLWLLLIVAGGVLLA